MRISKISNDISHKPAATYTRTTCISRSRVLTVVEVCEFITYYMQNEEFCVFTHMQFEELCDKNLSRIQNEITPYRVFPFEELLELLISVGNSSNCCVCKHIPPRFACGERSELCIGLCYNGYGVLLCIDCIIISA